MCFFSLGVHRLHFCGPIANIWKTQLAHFDFGQNLFAHFQTFAEVDKICFSCKNQSIAEFSILRKLSQFIDWRIYQCTHKYNSSNNKYTLTSIETLHWKIVVLLQIIHSFPYACSWWVSQTAPREINDVPGLVCKKQPIACWLPSFLNISDLRPTIFFFWYWYVLSINPQTSWSYVPQKVRYEKRELINFNLANDYKKMCFLCNLQIKYLPKY